MIIKHTFNPEDSLDRRYVEKLADKLLHGVQRSAHRIQGAAPRERLPSRPNIGPSTSIPILLP